MYKQGRYGLSFTKADDKYQVVQPSCIRWKEIRNEFFKQCTTERKVNMAPHDMFEWFKRAVGQSCDPKLCNINTRSIYDNSK